VDPEERRYRRDSIVRLTVMGVGTAVVAAAAVRSDATFLWVLTAVGAVMTAVVARMIFAGTR
jgi:hypothetical protein